jgi:hypothetical protein
LNLFSKQLLELINLNAKEIGLEGSLNLNGQVGEAELRRLAAIGAENGDLARLAQVQERVDQAGRRRSEIENELELWVAQDISEEQVAAALVEFNTVWATLAPNEQARVLALLIEQIDHDGVSGNVAITFRPSGLKSLTVTKPNLEETAA